MRYRGKGYTNTELVAMAMMIEADPANRNPPGSLRLFTAGAQKKLDEIARAVTDNLAEARKKEGDPVSCDGYSGRQSNRR